jgi:hypothetical protein
MTSGSTYRVVMVGTRAGERDYLERMLPDGTPCLTGNFPAYAGVFPKVCAERIAANLRRRWMDGVHVAVELEPVTDDAAGEPQS